MFVNDIACQCSTLKPDTHYPSTHRVKKTPVKTGRASRRPRGRVVLTARLEKSIVVPVPRRALTDRTPIKSWQSTSSYAAMHANDGLLHVRNHSDISDAVQFLLLKMIKGHLPSFTLTVQIICDCQVKMYSEVIFRFRIPVKLIATDQASKG